MSAHAELSPSSAVRWMSCPGSVALTRDLPDTSSGHAEEGTAAHWLAEQSLRNDHPAAQLVGEVAENGVPITADMARDVQTYVDYVRDVVRSTQGELLIEQRLPIGHLTGEPGAHGTADAVVLAGDELIVIDLKFGRGVAVQADDNPQLQIYALAALEEFGIAQDFQRARLVIHQPRLNTVSEWAQPVTDLQAFGEEVAEAAEFTRREAAPLIPTEKGCRWCKAKATCTGLARKVQDEIGADFDDLTALTTPEIKADVVVRDAQPLASALKAADLIEVWLKAVRAEAEARLLAGQAVPGFKLVRGKKGNRAWSDAEAAEELLKDTFRLKVEEMYELSLITPTVAEKLAPKLDKSGKPAPRVEGQPKPRIGPRQWDKLAALITQSDGKPSVAPESDKRPALVMSAVADDFSDVTATDCDLA
jgi:hypothetical protein